MALVKDIHISEVSGKFDDILDVRSPAEFAEDHIPGAISVPVLDNDERARIGTLYTQVSVFEAQRQGAALIARNIARHLEATLKDKPRHWQPLVYCWRGGQRSGAMAHILAQVGWRTGRLQGGYKAYRRHVIDGLASLPAGFEFKVVCGATGSGKSRLLQVLATRGAQVLDLERLAQHRGSLLGNLPDQPQPSQKMFETRLWDALRNFQSDRTVFVEAESRKVGILNVPDAILNHMRAAPCIAVEAPLQARVDFLLEDYAHFLQNPQLLEDRLRLLTELHGHKVIDTWCDLAQQGQWQALVETLLANHYDPAYRRSSVASYPQLKNALVLQTQQLDAVGFERIADELLSEEIQP
jgi:tRNA 2-selenouridine synthase